MADVKTYNPKKVVTVLGNHIASGYADETFISIEKNGDGTSVKVGCDGEVVRSINPDSTYKITLTLSQSSPTNSFLRNMYKKDKSDGTGMFPFMVKDLMGKQQFVTSQAWVNKDATWERGKESGNVEWELTAGDGAFAEG